jgi:hypothetical protein
MIPAVVVLKDRPLGEPGHTLYAVTTGPGRRKASSTCAVHCACGVRLAVGIVSQYQAALDLAARNHRKDVAMAAKHVGPWTPLGVAMAEARRMLEWQRLRPGEPLPLDLPPVPVKPKPPAVDGQLSLLEVEP